MDLRHEFSMPTFATVAGVSYETGEADYAVELEAVGRSDWFVDRCFVQVHAKRKWTWVEVPQSDPLFQTIKDWAEQEHRVALNDLWSDYLAKAPAPRRSYDTNAELRTHGGSL
jgi:hypothetical protein